MGHVRIDSKKCLNRYQNISCTKCEEICPQGAIHKQKVDEIRCDFCGLCSSVCPIMAIETKSDIGHKLAVAVNGESVIFSCKKVNVESPFSCLGFLQARLLWAIAQRHAVAIDISRCQSCREKVDERLKQEVAVCNKILVQQEKAVVDFVIMQKSISDKKKVSRRDFFRQLLGAAVETVEAVVIPEETEEYANFNEGLFLQDQVDKVPTGSRLFYAIKIADTCNVCGMCSRICPTQALQSEEKNERLQLYFNPLQCKHCGLCEINCPKGALQVTVGFDGNTRFIQTLPQCKICGKVFKPIADSEVCFACHQKNIL